MTILFVEEALSKMDLSELTKLGIDEISLKKNHNYITLFVNLITKKIMYITDDEDSRTVTDFVDFMGDHNGNVILVFQNWNIMELPTHFKREPFAKLQI